MNSVSALRRSFTFICDVGQCSCRNKRKLLFNQTNRVAAHCKLQRRRAGFRSGAVEKRACGTGNAPVNAATNVAPFCSSIILFVCLHIVAEWNISIIVQGIKTSVIYLIYCKG